MAPPFATAVPKLPWLVLVLLLALCLAHGLRSVAGVQEPPDVDLLRDVGFMQGFLDGNPFGDPTYAGEWRWYPPLIPAVGAMLFLLSRGVGGGGAADLLRFWVQAGPWLNLLAPLAFFLMARRLLASAPAAAVATAVFVVFNGAISDPWDAGGYTPWPFVPGIAQAFFCATAWLIHRRVGPAGWCDAALVGAAIGLTFLAHAVPAVVLTAAVTAAGFAVQGLRLRTVAWLALVAAVQLAVMAVFLGPLLLHYPAGVAHTAPALYSDWLMQPPLQPWVVVMNTPGIVALAMTLALSRAAPLGRATIAMLAAWIGVCAAFLLRHYACAAILPPGGGGGGGAAAAPRVCLAFTVAVHHYHLYLQLAWACLMGHVAWHVARLWVAPPRPPGRLSRWRAAVAAGLAALLLALGGYGLMRRHFDRDRRASVLSPGGPGDIRIDLGAYRWILANTGPAARFVTDLADPRDESPREPAAFAVITAGRNLVAGPELHSNPYVPWEAREARRRAYLAAATGAGPGQALCGEDAAGLLFILPKRMAVEADRLDPIAATELSTIYRIAPGACEAAATAAQRTAG